jgi:spermidine synthase
VLGLAVFSTGFSGLMAEYSVSTVVAYLTGDSIAAYSVLIGVFMASMGVGAIASERSPEGGELTRFLAVETLLSLVVAASSIVITQAAVHDLTWPAALGVAVIVGTLVGFEIPLLLRFNASRQIVLKRNIALVLGADYLGAFVASMLYVTWFLPHLGTVNTPVVSGAVNLAIAAVVLVSFQETHRAGLATSMTACAAAILAMGLVGERLVFESEQRQYGDPIVFSEQTAHQKIVVTQYKKDFCLFLNGQTQFCTEDEHRYHEALVHPAMWVSPEARQVLVLGGGDGLAIREVLKYSRVERIVLVDLDPRMVELARDLEPLRAANGGSLDDPRVQVVVADGFSWLGGSRDLFDVVLIDLPDPGYVGVAKLYSREFYQLVRNHLGPDGVMVTQSTSPIHATEAFSIIWHTIDEAGLATLPYRVYVPSFGDWGFNLAVREGHLDPKQLAQRLDRFEPRVPTRFLNNAAMQAATRFEKGIFPDDPSGVPVSRLVRPAVFDAYQRAWDGVD